MTLHDMSDMTMGIVRAPPPQTTPIKVDLVRSGMLPATRLADLLFSKGGDVIRLYIEGSLTITKTCIKRV